MREYLGVVRQRQGISWQATKNTAELHAIAEAASCTF